jgi:hypothetical protein
VQSRVFRLVDHTHPAATELFNDEIVGNSLARKRLGIGHCAGILLCAPHQVNEVGDPPHGMPATRADTISADLLEFIKSK